MEVEYFQVQIDGRDRAFLRETLAQLRVPATRKIKDEVKVKGQPNREEETSTLLDSDEKIKEACPEGRWIKVKFRDRINGSDIERARALQWKNDGLGRMIEQPWRYAKAWVLTLLEDWSYDKDDFTLDERGLNKLPDEAVEILEVKLINWKDSISPNSLRPLTLPCSS